MAYVFKKFKQFFPSAQNVRFDQTVSFWFYLNSNQIGKKKLRFQKHQTILAVFLYFILLKLPDAVANSVRLQGFFFLQSVRVYNSVNARSKMDINEVLLHCVQM